MLLHIMNLAAGYLDIRITGAGLPKLLTLCAEDGIMLWDMKKEADGSLTASVRISGFRRMRRIAKRSMCRIHITARHGLPFFTAKFAGRYALGAGLLLCAAAIAYLSGFVWTVEVNGCAEVTPAVILDTLEKNGFHLGMRAKEVDVPTLRNAALTELHDLLWLTVVVNGSHAEVTVVEREKPPEMLPVDTPCSVFARRDGVVTEMTVKNGITVAAKDQTVAAGDLLISGEQTSELTGIRLMHAMGEVEARTWYRLQAVSPRPTLSRERTGREKKRFAVVFGTKRINLYSDYGNPYELCDKIIERKLLWAGEGFRMPVALVKERFLECTASPADAEYNSKADMLLAAALENKLSELLGKGSVTKAEFLPYTGEDAYIAVLEAECLEDIAEKRPINGG